MNNLSMNFINLKSRLDAAAVIPFSALPEEWVGCWYYVLTISKYDNRAWLMVFGLKPELHFRYVCKHNGGKYHYFLSLFDSFFPSRSRKK